MLRDRVQPRSTTLQLHMALGCMGSKALAHLCDKVRKEAMTQEKLASDVWTLPRFNREHFPDYHSLLVRTNICF